MESARDLFRDALVELMFGFGDRTVEILEVDVSDDHAYRVVLRASDHPGRALGLRGTLGPLPGDGSDGPARRARALARAEGVWADLVELLDTGFAVHTTADGVSWIGD